MNELNISNKDYWIKRAQGYSEVNKEELSGIQRDSWKAFLTKTIDASFEGKSRDEISILYFGRGRL